MGGVDWAKELWGRGDTHKTETQEKRDRQGADRLDEELERLGLAE